MDWSDLEGELPRQTIVQALDDNGDGEPDASAWAGVLESVSRRIRDCFGGDPPDRAKGACTYAERLFALEIIFRRRGFDSDRNPFAAQAKDAEARLRRIASGEDSTDGGGGGIFASKPARISNSNFNLI